MKKAKISNKLSNFIITEDALPENAVKISYSQYSIYSQCPHRWFLQYALKDFRFTSSIDTIFGTAMHETLQEYLTILFNDSIKSSEEFKIYSFLENSLIENYKKEKINNNNRNFTTPELLNEYYEDGCEIIKWIKNRRKTLFDVKNTELVAIEAPILVKINDDDDSPFYFKAFLDIILYDKINDVYIIKDLKTSKSGWGSYQKKSKEKIDQLLLYKKYFSKQFNVPEEKINVVFEIVKRKILTESEYPQPRLSKFEPANGKNKVSEADRGMKMFINDCFNQDGTVQEKYYRKNPGTGAFSNCKFCPFKDECDKKNY